MSWKARSDEQRYPPGFATQMDRDGGLYNAFWQRGGNQLQEFIEKDHMYRYKFAKPPEWLEKKEWTELDHKFAKLQKAKQKDHRKKVDRRKMIGKGKLNACKPGECSVVSDDEEDVADVDHYGGSSSSSVRTSQCKISSSSENATNGGAGGLGFISSGDPAQDARRKNTIEAAKIRRDLTEKGRRGTYKFGQEPTEKEVKELLRTQSDRAASANAGTYKFDDNVKENYSMKWKEKPANACESRLPYPIDVDHKDQQKVSNWNDPRVINQEREKKGKRTSKKISDAGGPEPEPPRGPDYPEIDAKADFSECLVMSSMDGSPQKLTTVKGRGEDQERRRRRERSAKKRGENQKASNILERENYRTLNDGGDGGGEKTTGAAKKTKKGQSKDDSLLLPNKLEQEPWVYENRREKSVPTLVRHGSIKMVKGIKIPKHLRKELMISGGPLLPYKALQRLTTSSDYDYALFRTDLQEPVKKQGEIAQYVDRHPYFRMGQRSRFYNNSNEIASLLHQGAAENFPKWDTELKDWPGYPFYNNVDQRERDNCRKVVGEDTFAAWDKPLISVPKAREFVRPQERLKKVEAKLSYFTQPQESTAFPEDPSSEAGSGV